MIESTKDILFLVLAFCILWFTTFVCWLLYYFIVVMRDVKNLVHGVKKSVERIEELAATLKEKVEAGASYFAVFAEIMRTAVGFAMEKKKKMAAKRKARKEAEEEL